MDNLHALQLAYRSQKSIGIFDASPTYLALPGFPKVDGNSRCCTYSPCGSLFAWASTDGAYVVDPSSGVLLNHISVPNILEISFSPRGTFVITWERPGRDENGDATKNLKIWCSVGGPADTPRGFLGSFVQKSQGCRNLQYTSDERLCARIVTNELHIYQSRNLEVVWNKLRLDGVADFALSPGSSGSIAAFVPERKGQPASVKVYELPELTSAVTQKSFYKGDKVQMKWNPRGSSVLVLAQTEVDRTNKSYYGETTLYLLNTDNAMDARIHLDKEGPIHDFAWSSNSREFAVIYGYMPAKTTIYNDSATAIHSFPIGPRNTIIFSPTGRFALIAGFGNLAGQIDVYDTEKNFDKVSTIESGNPSVCQWSPDDQYIVTATTSPRLRVDNGIKIWHVGGQLVYHEDMIELYDVEWRPSELPENARRMEDPLATVPFQHQSAIAHLGVSKLPAKQAGVYRPPGARGLATPLHFKREDEGGAAHTVGNVLLPSSSAGFGSRARRVVPGAEPIDGSQIMRRVPGSEPVREELGLQSSSKIKKKKNKRRGNQEPAITVTDPSVPSLNKGSTDIESPPTASFSHGMPGDDQAVVLARGQDVISQLGGSDTGEFQESGRKAVPLSDATAPPIPEAPPQNPLAKKIRSLHKKVRAIQDLELRLASGAKLEDTQIKKISTKESVQQELDILERVLAIDSKSLSEAVATPRI